MRTFNIKPKVKGKKVLDPISFTPLNETGEEKPRNAYWLRRILDGSVMEFEPEVKAEAETDTIEKVNVTAKDKVVTKNKVAVEAVAEELK